jgi:hypothetical protein
LQVPTVSHREHAAYNLQAQRLHHVLLKTLVLQLGVLLLEVVLPPKMQVPQLGARREVVVLLKGRALRLYRKMQALGHSVRKSLDPVPKMPAS